MSIYSAFAKPPNSTHPWFSYGFLAVILILLATVIQLKLSLPPTYPHNRNECLVVPFMLLFNHLAHEFRWPPAATVALRILAWSWLVIGLFYIFFFSSVH
jgi:hypothetical protein